MGAVIGAAVGGTAGALIGKKMDKQKKELEATLPEDTKIESVNNGEALKVTLTPVSVCHELEYVERRFQECLA